MVGVGHGVGVGFGGSSGSAVGCGVGDGEGVAVGDGTRRSVGVGIGEMLSDVVVPACERASPEITRMAEINSGAIFFSILPPYSDSTVRGNAMTVPESEVWP